MQSLNKPNVLIVDDEKSNTFLLSRILGKLECEVVTAGNGWEALEVANKQDFALILLDILMPELNGYETLVRIKSSTINKETPVFLMTEMETDQDLLIKAYNAGAVDFIPKPINLKVLQRKTKYFLDFYNQKQALKDARTRAESLMKSRLAMMADITHELRTPLFAMMGMVEGLKSLSETPQQKHLIHRIEVNSENLLDTVNDFLDFSKFESTEQKLENEFFSLKKLLNDIVDVMNYQYHKNEKVRLELIYGMEVPEFVRSDRKKIRHILMNLFSNAIKFTQEGSVKLEVRYIGEKEGKPYLKFSVTDTGVGIPMEKVESIFREYAQVENELQGVVNATGLGLSIVKKMVDVLNGNVKVKSKVGHGSTFSFSIPVETAEESDLQEVSDPTSFDELLGDKDIDILIVDDVPDNLFVLRNYLNIDNINLSLTHKIDESIELMSTKKFDIVFLDINMPDRSGFELAQDYRKLCKENDLECGEIVLLSAHTQDIEIEKKLLKAKINHYLMKPIKKGQLFEKIVSLAHGHGEVEDLKVSTFTPNRDDEDYDFSFLDQDFIDYLPRYLTLKEEEMSRVVAGIEKQDKNAVLAECHKILGTAKSFGLNRFANDLESVQSLTKKEFFENLEEIQSLANKCYDFIVYLKDNLDDILKEERSA